MNKRNVGLSSNGKPIRTYNNSSSVTWEFGNKNHESLSNGAASIVGETSSTKTTGSFTVNGFKRLSYAQNALI
jgi:hypothetical protein